MSNQIEQYTGAGRGLAGADGAQVDAGAGLHVGQMEFTDRGNVSLHDLPQAPMPGAPDLPLVSTVTAGGAGQRPKAVRSPGGQIVQVRDFWHAWPTQVVFHQVMRPLTKGGDGKLRPAGVWQPTERVTCRVQSGPVQQATMVDDTVDPEPVNSPGADTDAGAKMRPEFEAGAFAQSALPRKARMWLNRELPDPTRWVGNVLRWDDGTETVDVLRGDEHRMVVVHAARPVGAPAWTLTRCTYTVVGDPIVHTQPLPDTAATGSGRAAVGSDPRHRRLGISR